MVIVAHVKWADVLFITEDLILSYLDQRNVSRVRSINQEYGNKVITNT